jgi:hypothetical protein
VTTLIGLFHQGVIEQPQVAIQDAPREVLSRGWRQLVEQPDGSLDRKFYTFCVLERLHDGLQRQDFVDLGKILSANMTASSKAPAAKKARVTLIDEWTQSQKASVRLFFGTD